MTKFNEPLTFLGYLRRILDTGDRTFGGTRSPYAGFRGSEG